MRNVVLIEAPSNLGLKEPIPGVEPGVKFFSSAMAKENFAALAEIKTTIHVEAPKYDGIKDEETGVKSANKIIEYSRELADAISINLKNEDLLVVLGGDCSILLGSALALKRNGTYGLFYLDGHTDYVLPHQSQTGGAAGMDLALVTGNGPSKFTNIQNLKPYIKEQNVFCCGNRYIEEEWYVEAVKQSNIYYYDLYDMQEYGLAELAETFLIHVSSQDLKGFWVHLDVDVLDDEIMPCVDSRSPGGLSYEELNEVLVPLLQSSLCAGINITIFDATLDTTGEYTKRLANELANILRAVNSK